MHATEVKGVSQPQFSDPVVTGNSKRARVMRSHDRSQTSLDPGDLRKAELLLVEQTRLLELTAAGAPMDDCLAAVCTLVSNLSADARACILLADAQRQTFLRLITPALPPSFSQGLEALTNELAIGTDGTEVYSGQPITCADIANDDCWSPAWRELCLAHGILSCHSTPILGADDLPLGSLMLCFDQARVPTDWERQLADFGTRMARVVFERDRSNLALRESAAEYRTLFESIDEGFCIVEMIFDAEGRPIDYQFVQVNPAFARLTGLPADALGKTARELVPDLEAFWIEVYGNVALTGEVARFENKSEPMNRWFDVYASRVGAASSHRVAIVFNNITERKRSEEILRRAAELDAFRITFTDALRPLADPAEIQATASRMLGEYLGANRVAYFEIRGADYVVERDYVNGVKTLMGSYPIDSFGPQLLAAYRSGRVVSASHVASDPNLSPAQHSAYAAIQIAAYIGIPLIKNGEFVAELAIHMAEPRDWMPDEVALAEEVAERTWATVEHARAEEQLRLATEASRLGLWFWNLETDCLIWTEQCKAVFGLPADAEMSYEIFLAALHPDDRQRTHEAVTRSIDERMDYDIEYRTCWPDGTIHWIAAKGSCTYDTTGQPTRMMGVVLDISDRKQAEVALQAHAHELSQINQLLAQTTALANQRNQELDQFAYIISHDLKAPLRAISNLSQWIEEDLADQVPPDTQKNLDLLRSRISRMEALIDGLLTYARIGYQDEPDQQFALNELLLEVIDSLNIPPEFTVQLPLNLPNLTTNRLLLSQVFMNLISNAVKHHHRTNGWVKITAQAQAQGYEFSVADNGPGIDPKNHSRVFDIFQTLSSQTQTKNTGIGLAIIKKTIERRGGCITLESELGRGATFSFTWPVS
jgi:PAS domain S-box-containing protein